MDVILCDFFPRDVARLIAFEFLYSPIRKWKSIAQVGEYETCLNAPESATLNIISGACRGQNFELAKCVADKYPSDMWCFVYFAIRTGQIEIVKSLPGGPECELQDYFYAAGRSGSIEMVHYFQSKTPDVQWNMVLLGGCRGGHIPIINLAISANVRLDWERALEAASRCRNLDVVRLVFSKVKTENLDSALRRACRSGHWPVIEFLLSKGAEMDNYAFPGLCKSGNLELVRKFIEHFDSNNPFTLECVCREGHLPVVELLISHTPPVLLDLHALMYTICPVCHSNVSGLCEVSHHEKIRDFLESKGAQACHHRRKINKLI